MPFEVVLARHLEAASFDSAIEFRLPDEVASTLMTVEVKPQCETSLALVTLEWFRVCFQMLIVSAPFVIHFKTLDAPVAFYSRHFRSKCDYKLDLQQS